VITSFTGFHWVWLGHIEFDPLLLGFPSFTGFYWVITSFTGFLQYSTGFYWVSPGRSRSSRERKSWAREKKRKVDATDPVPASRFDGPKTRIGQKKTMKDIGIDVPVSAAAAGWTSSSMVKPVHSDQSSAAAAATNGGRADAGAAAAAAAATCGLFFRRRCFSRRPRRPGFGKSRKKNGNSTRELGK